VPLSQDAFERVVRGGALLDRGMPVFEELSDDELEALRHYLRERARDISTAASPSSARP